MWWGFILLGFGTMFVVGELLVKARGFLVISGLLMVVGYFSVGFTDLDSFQLLFFYMVGLLLILLDGKFLIGDFLAMLGLFLMLLSVYSVAGGFIMGLYSILAVVLGISLSFLFLKVLPRRSMWDRVILSDRLTTDKGYSTLDSKYLELVGKEGVTTGDLRPVGVVDIGGVSYRVESEGSWVSAGVVVKVLSVDGVRILVEEVGSEVSE